MQTHEITKELSQDQFMDYLAQEEAFVKGTDPQPEPELKEPEVEARPDPEPEAEKPADADEEEDEAKLSGEQKAIKRLTAQRYKAQAERDLFKAELEALKAKATTAPEPTANAKPAEVIGKPVKPVLKDFADWDLYQEANEAYIAAVVQFTTTEAVTKALETRDKQAATQTRAEREKQAGDAWSAKEQVFMETAPDYDELVRKNKDLKISNIAAAAIVSEDNGAAIAYYLAKNLAEANRINSLDDISQVKEITKIAVKVAPVKEAAKEPPAEPRKRSEAPAPPKLVSGRSAPPDPLPDPNDFAATERWENKHFPLKGRL